MAVASGPVDADARPQKLQRHLLTLDPLIGDPLLRWCLPTLPSVQFVAGFGRLIPQEYPASCQSYTGCIGIGTQPAAPRTPRSATSSSPGAFQGFLGGSQGFSGLRPLHPCGHGLSGHDPTARLLHGGQGATQASRNGASSSACKGRFRY